MFPTSPKVAIRPFDQIGELATCPVGRFASWPVGHLASWPVGRLAGCPVGRLASWPVDQTPTGTLRWEVGRLASWPAGHLRSLFSSHCCHRRLYSFLNTWSILAVRAHADRNGGRKSRRLIIRNTYATASSCPSIPPSNLPENASWRATGPPSETPNPWSNAMTNLDKGPIHWPTWPCCS